MRRLCKEICYICLIAMCAVPVSAGGGTFGEKQALQRCYPWYMSFRGEYNRRINSDYETWSKAVDANAGLMRKFVSEELVIGPEKAVWANRYAAGHPEKLVMLHLNGESRQVQDFPEVMERYFPGHWVYEEGAMLVENLSGAETVLKVDDIKPFLKKGYPVRNTSPLQHLPLKLLIVRLDGDGGRLWYESEFAEICHVDAAEQTVTVKRGIYGSRPLDFSAGRAYVAPLAGGLWGKHVMPYYNLSSSCPVDRDGKKANEVYAEEIASWFAEDGILSAFDGIAFDVNYSDVSEKGSGWDVDNDGNADGGWIAGRNVWKEGDVMFFRYLRELTGNQFIISSDAQHWSNQQLPDILDGMESEGLVQHNDMWRGFSRAVNTHLYWEGHGRSQTDYRYVVMKIMGPDSNDALRYRRFGAASAFCLGAGVTEPVGDNTVFSSRDFVPEEFRVSGSLGRHTGPLVRYAMEREPVYGRQGASLDVSGAGLSCYVDGTSLVLSAETAAAEDGNVPEMCLTIKDVPVPSGDVVFSVTATVLEYDSEIGSCYHVPAVMWLEPSVLPSYDKNRRYDGYFKDLYGLFNSEREETMTYYFRNMQEGIQDVRIRVRGADKVRIDDFRVYNAPDVLIRNFENGVVVVNPSLSEVELDISGYAGYKKGGAVVTVPPVDALYLKHQKLPNSSF